jgi:predicted lipid-binding transport protein (Tim44 family)
MDILFFAAIAIFIFIKLRNELGKVDDNQKRDAIKKFIKEQTKNSKNSATIIEVSENSAVEAKQTNQDDEKSQKILEAIKEPIKSNLQSILQKTNLSASQFINGANSAFEIVLESFAANNLQALKPLLSEKIYADFEKAVSKRKSEKQTLHTKIVSIKKSYITDAKIVDNFAIITVEFISEQINYITDDKGEFVFGSKHDIDQVKDVWTFKKDCNSSNPNWLVVSTS